MPPFSPFRFLLFLVGGLFTTTGPLSAQAWLPNEPALRTPQRAAERTQPCATVEFLDGTYTYDGSGDLLAITRSRQPDAYIT